MKVKNSIKDAAKSLADYMATYDKQFEYEHYSNETLINDVLYGLGIALNPDEYKFADGFVKFKRDLKDFISENSP